MELWFVRHGTTSGNLERRFQGQMDLPLSSQGRREAGLLARRLSSAGLEIIYSSDLQRAWETATIIGRAVGLDPVATPLLRECSWGALEGLTVAEAEELYPELMRRYRSASLRAGFFGGERERKLLARARTLLNRLAGQNHRFRRVLLVGHARQINACFAAALGWGSRQQWPFAPAPASLSILRYYPARRRFRLELFNARICTSCLM